MANFTSGINITRGVTINLTVTPISITGTVSDDTWFTPQTNTLTVNNNIGTVNASVTSGSLPPGFTLNTSGGNVIISGIPT